MERALYVAETLSVPRLAKIARCRARPGLTPPTMPQNTTAAGVAINR
ncbi:hypothetical protein EMGR_004579 [Emarellia grisea]